MFRHATPQPTHAQAWTNYQAQHEPLDAREREEVRDELIADSITREELLEEITMTFTQADDDLLMHSIARGEPKDACVVLAQLITVKDRIFRRRKAEDDAKARARKLDDGEPRDDAPRHRTFILAGV